MTPLENLFNVYDTRHEQWRVNHYTKKTVNNLRHQALSAFDKGLAEIFGHPLAEHLGNMGTRQRAFRSAKTQSEVAAAYEAAVSNVATAYGTATPKYVKAVHRYDVFKTQALNRIGATTSTSGGATAPPTTTNLPGQTSTPQNQANLNTLWNDLMAVVDPTNATTTGRKTSAPSQSTTDWTMPIILAVIGLAYFIFRKK